MTELRGGACYGRNDPMSDPEVPNSVSSCGRCEALIIEGGGTVRVETFDGSAPECGSPRLCSACYATVYGLVRDFLFPGFPSDDTIEGWLR